MLTSRKFNNRMTIALLVLAALLAAIDAARIIL